MKNLMTKTFKGLMTLTLILLMSNAYSQTKYKGYFCTGVNEFSPIQYTREYKEEGDTYTTIYKIYSSRNGYYLNITATHYKSEKRVVVDIDDITVKVGGHISTQEVSYDEPSMKMFGRQGAFKAQFDAQNVLPNEIAVKFVSSKYENVKVVHIAKDTGMNSTKWYVLDEEN
ncbi:MAG: hypothetical protein WD048_02715 [Chitinophagales bacterium]